MSTEMEPKVVYEQLCQDFRSLNGFLWQTPIIVMTLTGGLWFSVANFELTDEARRALLVFAAAADMLMIGALIRLRYVMATVQAEIKRRDGRPSAGQNGIIVGLFSLLLALTAVGSAIAAHDPAKYFTKRSIQTQLTSGALGPDAPAALAASPDASKRP